MDENDENKEEKPQENVSSCQKPKMGSTETSTDEQDKNKDEMEDVLSPEVCMSLKLSFITL